VRPDASASGASKCATCATTAPADANGVARAVSVPPVVAENDGIIVVPA
jgi:hypothetical protein